MDGYLCSNIMGVYLRIDPLLIYDCLATSEMMKGVGAERLDGEPTE